MSDATIIALIFAGCFVLWLILQRRRPSPLEPILATKWPSAAGLPPPQRPAAVDLPRTYTLATSAVLSPDWHTANGWPAVAVEYFPSLGSFAIDDIKLTAHVEATYDSPDLPDLKLQEGVENPPEIVLVSLQQADEARIKARFSIGAGILERANKAPAGYQLPPKSVSVDICMTVIGRANPATAGARMSLP